MYVEIYLFPSSYGTNEALRTLVVSRKLLSRVSGRSAEVSKGWGLAFNDMDKEWGKISVYGIASLVRINLAPER